jgi:hypothetical protein
MRALALVLVVAGCTNGTYLVVTVDARPAVQGADSLVITLTNAGTSRMDTLSLAGHVFPVTFSVSAPGRTGELDIKVEADTTDMLVVGRGSASATIGASETSVMLETTDFVVNTDYAMDQFLDEDYEANGFQLAATSDGHWTAGFRDGCPTNTCTIYGRSFDTNGVPATTTAAAGTNAFSFTTTMTTTASTPALAASGTTTFAFWDYFTPGGGSDEGVACRSLDASGNLTPGQMAITTEEADVVAASPLANGNLAVTWQVYLPTYGIHSAIVQPDCTAIGSAVAVSTTVGTDMVSPGRADVAANGGAVLYSWVQDGGVHIRIGNNTSIMGADTLLVPVRGTSAVTAARLAPMGSGFALGVRWADNSGTAPGKIELYQVSATGSLVGPAQLITDQSRSDFPSGEMSFGMATNGAGVTMIAWHVCDTSGSSCDVFGQFANADGTLNGSNFMVPTTTLGDQTGPSVVGLPTAFAVAWTDSSHAAPDTDGTAVRARIVYPPK